MTSGKGRELFEALTDLADALQRAPNLDSKLANYVFFPLSHIFSRATALPSRILAAAIKCLQLMLEKGWRVDEEIDLFMQLLILLSTLLTHGTQNGEAQDLLQRVVDCFTALFDSMRATSCSIQAMDSEKMTPIIGQIIFTMLTIAKENSMVTLQNKTLIALQSLVFHLENMQIWRSFFPGIVSQLTKILQPTSQHRRNSKVLVLALTVLSALLKNALSERSSTSTTEEKTKNRELSLWAHTMSPQLLLALTKIGKLQFHEKSEVQAALCKLCFSIMEEYGHWLPDCQSTSLKIVVTTCSQDLQGDTSTYDHLSRLINASEQIKSRCEQLCYGWISSLPRILQSTDLARIEHRVSCIKIAYQALLEADADPTPLYEALRGNFKDCIVIVLDGQAKQSITPIDALAMDERRDLLRATNRGSSQSLVVRPSAPLQALALQSLQDLLFITSFTKSSRNYEANFAASVLEASRENRVVSSWILARLLDADSRDSSKPGRSLQSGQSISIKGDLVDLALNQALTILSDSKRAEMSDLRAELMSLEILTILAQQQGEDFRSTFVDTLYPIVERLGSSETTLRDYTIRCLDYISYACDYRNPGDMVVQNVDYLVNAIALELNAFDTNSLAPQVLVMMLELSGPRLIPYLDDTLEHVFAILASYHGYSRLVESSWSFLSSIVKEARLSPTLRERLAAKCRKKGNATSAVHEVSRLLDQVEQYSTSEVVPNTPTESDSSDIGSLTKSDDTTMVVQDASVAESSGQGLSSTPKIYSTIQSVLRLSQFYLTREEPHLRRRLLDLIANGCPILSTNQDEFLPLVNDLWPVMIQRLYDEEAFVSLAAMQTLSELFKGAGDFLASRMEDEWHDIQRLYRQLEKKAAATNRSKASTSPFAHATQAYEGMIGMLVDLTYYVRLTSEMEDDIFTMLGTVAKSQTHVKNALQRLNEDALWLVLDLTSFNDTTPIAKGYHFQPVAVD